MRLDNQRFSALFVIILCSFLCMSDCYAQPVPAAAPAVKGSPTDVLAQIADSKVTRADFDKEVAAFKKFAAPQAAASLETMEGKQDFLRQLVEVTLFEKKAKVEGLQNSEDYKKEVHQALLNNFAMNRFKTVVEAVTVDDAEAKKFYDANLKDFTEPDQYHLFWISTDTKEKADAIVKDINSGKSFIEVAKANSIDESKNNGGDRGFIRLEDETPEVGAALEKLEKDKISAPINVAESLYVIVKYTEKKTGIVKPFDTVVSQIRRELANEKQVVVFKSEIEKLKKAYNFKLDEKVAETIRKPELSETELNAVIAKYDGHEIKVSEVYKDLEQIPTFIRPQILNGDGLNDFLDQNFARTLATADAEKNFDAYSKANPETVADVSRRSLVKCLFDKVLTPVVVTDEEVSDFYKKNLAQFEAPASMKAHHILVDDEATAKALMENIKKDPSKFEEIAKVSSKCPSKANGGDLGEFAEGQMVPEFEKACKEAEVNKVVGPVKTQFGYHLIRVDSRRAAGTRKLEEVKDEIKAQMLPQKQKDTFDAYLESLRKEFNVKEYRDNL